MPLAAMGPVRLEFNGGGGGNRTRVRGIRTSGHHMLLPVFVLANNGSTGQDSLFASLKNLRDFRSGGPGRISRISDALHCPTGRAGEDVAALCSQ